MPLVTSKQQAVRKKALGQEPGKKIRTIGFLPPKIEPSDVPDIVFEHLKRLGGEKPKSRLFKAPNNIQKERTPFEQAVVSFLQGHARAALYNRPVPTIPKIIRKKYPGAKLDLWLKTILRSGLYKQAKQSVSKR